jgi:hypothetical protein
VHPPAPVADDAEAGVGGARIDAEDDHASGILRSGPDASPARP